MVEVDEFSEPKMVCFQIEKPPFLSILLEKQKTRLLSSMDIDDIVY